MKLGAVYSDNVNALYRVVIPMRELQRRNHEVVGAMLARGERLQIEPLADCELVQIHRMRFFDDDDPVARLKEAGVAICFDEDDDMSAGTAEVEAIVGNETYASGRRNFDRLLEKMPEADLVTTPSETLADRFEAAGARTIEVIDNYLLDELVGTNSLGHEGFVVGWHACAEHVIDAERLGLGEVFKRLLGTHPDLIVKTIGVDLELDHERYVASRSVPFNLLTQHLADFDIGIAPLADTTFGRGRSNVKVREYAAAGVPWLASNLGPYRDLGPSQGGLLVDDGDWYAALDELIRDDRARRAQSERARRWGTYETISNTVHLWEEAFQETIAETHATT